MNGEMELTMIMTCRALCLAGLAIVASGCTTAAEHQQSLGSTAEREMTLGIVQKEIRAGLTQAEVATALGSPNIVTRDAVGNETWIYDKVATEASYSRRDAYGTILILGGSSAAGAAASTQKTLTVVIKFDGDQRVETFSYHSSRF
jgi:outer membrane protein assembly factor BamE (lipoprotein component of BamABCDE complex)